MSPRFKSLGNPILLLSDSPESLTGLGRVCRDLASLLCTLPQFRVATLGRGAVGRSKFPWQQYSYPESTGQWGEDYLAKVCEDFFRGDWGIVLSNWDVSRLGWLTDPSRLPEPYRTAYGPDRQWSLWGYIPVDANGPVAPAYGTEMSVGLKGYDRLIAASEWGQGVLRESGRLDANWIPHGIWMQTFKSFSGHPKDSKDLLGWQDKIVLGCNMANQARKDWPIAFECAARLKATYGNQFLFWAHTNVEINYWNLYALAADYGMSQHTTLSKDLNDEQLAFRYSACECTILPSAGEGFGYPIAESMACGTPCVVTNYASGQELVNEDCRVDPVAYRVDTQYNLQRAVLQAIQFRLCVGNQMEKKRLDWAGYGQTMREKVAHLDWPKLGDVWKKWFVEGVK